MSFKKFSSDCNSESNELVRSGIKGLDQLFGGGIPLNNLVVIEQDEFNVCSNLLIRCVASNCLYEKQKLVYAFSDCKPPPVESFLRTLPVRQDAGTKALPANENMEIAFRYNYMPSLASGTSFTMDFGKKIDEKEMREKQLSSEKIELLNSVEAFERLSKACSGKFSSAAPTVIIFDSLKFTRKPDSSLICGAFYRLKSYSRNYPKSLILVTYQPDCLSMVTRKRVRNISDSTLQVETLDPSKPSVYGPEFKALLHVHKITRISLSGADNSIGCTGIKLERNNRYFCIEKLFLQPDLGDTPSRVPSTGNSSEIF